MKSIIHYKDGSTETIEGGGPVYTGPEGIGEHGTVNFSDEDNTVLTEDVPVDQIERIEFWP